MWKYLQPVTICFGEGVSWKLEQTADQLGCRKGLLVSDPFFVKNGLAQKFIETSGGKLAGIYSQVSPNPEVTEVDACAQEIKENKYDFLAALGGGSALDCAKAAGSICFEEKSIREYHGTGKNMPQRHLPLIAIPTTAGTGSEVTCVAVLSDKELGKKGPIVSSGFYPTIALIDPELTYTLSPYMTASTGIDVLCHAVEGFWSKNHQPVCDALALHVCKIVFTYLKIACREPDNREARSKMAEASVLAGMAFTLPKTTSSHACSFPLTNLYHIPHGEACGLTLDYFAKINAEAQNGRIQRFAKEVGFQNMYDMADAIHRLKMELGLRTNLKEFCLSDEQVEELVSASRHSNIYNNPVEITDNMLRKMYQEMR